MDFSSERTGGWCTQNCCAIFCLLAYKMHLLCLLMSPRGMVSDVLSRKSSSMRVWLDCASRCWFWLAGLNSLALQILDVTHGAHLRFKSFGFDSLQQLELAHSEGDSWGLWPLLVNSGHACRGAPAGMLELRCAQAQQYHSPSLLSFLGTLLFGPTPSFFPTGADLWAGLSCRLSPTFLRVPSNGSNSMYWNASYPSNASKLCLVSRIRKLIWQKYMQALSNFSARVTISCIGNAFPGITLVLFLAGWYEIQ